MGKAEQYTKYLGKMLDEIRNRYLQVDARFYDIVDELGEKVYDLNPRTKFEVKLKHSYKFLDEWENGDVSSAYVLDILKTWDIEDVANLSVIRPLNNFMYAHDEFAEHVKGTIAQIRSEIIPMYKMYLERMIKFFEMASKVDARQIPVTWLEVTSEVDGSIKTKCDELTLNQVVRQIDAYVLKYIDHKMFLENNMVCISEVPHGGVQRSHWIFAPEAYVNFLKKTYDINESLDTDGDVAYVKKIIGEYV